MKKIAALAEPHYIALAPHSAADPLGIVASLHATAGTPTSSSKNTGAEAARAFSGSRWSFRRELKTHAKR